MIWHMFLWTRRGILERNLKPWDFAAGKIIVEEAGGRVIDIKGSSANAMAPSDIIAGNGYIEEDIKKLLIERRNSMTKCKKCAMIILSKGITF